jgi:cytidylate kinase
VREVLTVQQRRIGAKGRVVMVGRDIGTVVMPDADLKIYLDASPEERARRRFLERQARGECVRFEDVLAVLRKRDRIDSGRASAPLRCAPDAVRIVTDGLDVQEVLERVMEVVNEREG